MFLVPKKLGLFFIFNLVFLSKMEKFQTYFGLHLAYSILKHTDNLATALQKRDLNAAQGN